MGYGQAAVCAATLCRENSYDPVDAWCLAVQEHIPTKSGRIKGCPKSAFLGLCSAGRVIGINSGNYTRSIDNRNYAITAVEILQNQEPGHTPEAAELWGRVMAVHEKSIKRNGQMEVVLALWDKGMIR